MIRGILMNAREQGAHAGLGRHRPAGDGGEQDRLAAGGGVTGRAVLVALFLLSLLALLSFYVELVWGKSWDGGGWWFTTGAPSVLPTAALFALTAAMGIPMLRRRGLRRRELLVVYCLLLIGVPTAGHAVMAWMLVRVIAFHYGAHVHTHWATAFLHLIPTWWSPTSPEAMEGFFQGRASAPWGEWAVPLAAWSSVAGAVFVATLCVMALVQRQWITHERLTFPLAQVPLELVQEPGRGSSRVAGQIPLASALGVGVLIGVAVNTLSTLSQKVPAFPQMSLFIYDLIPWQRVGPLAGLGGLTLVFWPWMIGLAYLIPADLSFSLWAFTIIRLLLTVAAIAAGATPQRPEDWYGSSFPAPVFQGTGAVLALAGWVLWVGRRHLGRAMRIALGRHATGEDAREPMGYRGALFGLVLSTVYLVYFLWLSGTRVSVGILLVLMTIGYFTVWARLRAENGMAFICYPCDIDHALGVLAGNSAFRPADTVAMITLRWVYRPGFSNSFEIFPGSALEAFKIADAANLEARRLTRWMVMVFAIGWALAAAVVLTGIYRHGWFGLAVSRGGWLGPMAIGDGNLIVSRLTPSSPEPGAIVGVLAGAAVTVALGLLRLRFWWWPLHPVGYLASNTWGAQWWFIPFFIGWAGKVLVTRYGGLRLYRRTVPFVVGLIVGDLLNGGLWALVAVAARGAI